MVRQHQSPTMISRPEPGEDWRTASSGRGANSSAAEQSTLGEQLSRCSEMRGRGFKFRCYGDATLRFAYAHFWTLVMVIALATGLAVLLA
jgi:ribosomal protein S12 methylthiotransferase accessory factor YcaO